MSFTAERAVERAAGPGALVDLSMPTVEHWRFSASFEPSENVSEGVKLLGFDGGVTVQGGLPVVIATPVHGTAFDIVGQGVASPRPARRPLRSPSRWPAGARPRSRRADRPSGRS